MTLRIPTLTILALLFFLLALGIGFAQEPGASTPYLQNALRELLPALTALAMTIITGLLAWVSAWIKARFAIEIEARHRAALHSALETGVARALDKLIELPAVTQASAAVNDAVAYAERSVPDAIKALAPSKEHLRDMAVAKAKEAILRATNRADDGWRAPTVPTK